MGWYVYPTGVNFMTITCGSNISVPTETSEQWPHCGLSKPGVAVCLAALQHYVSSGISIHPLIAILACCLTLNACASFTNGQAVKGGSASATPPGVLSFPEPDPDFAEYISHARTYIQAHQLPHRNAAAVDYNAPFEVAANPNVPYRGLFLFIHGLNDSPFVWRDFAKAIAEHGFDGRAILLPGFGTTPAALLDISYKQWLTAARKHLQLAVATGKPVYVGGFSLGGVLATLLALESPDIEGLLLVSPAYRSKLNHLLRWAWLYQRFEPWLFGGMILEDNPAKYNSIPINSGTQYYRTTQYLKRRWGDRSIDLPVVMVATTDDSVVDVDHLKQTFNKRFVGKERQLILYDSTVDSHHANGITWRYSARPELRILNQSHLSLINDQDNELYGQSGSVLVCNGNEPAIFFACLRADEHWYGAQHTESPDAVAVARSTYNPDFDFIVTRVVETLTRASE